MAERYVKYKVMKLFTTPNHRGLLWLLFACVSGGLLAMYVYADTHRHPAFESALKGLDFIDHFLIHFSVGILAGMFILLGSLVWQRRRLCEPLIFTATVFWSHLPDLRSAMTKDLHDPWEVIFLFHTLVDEIPWIVWIMVPVNVVLIIVYCRRLKSATHADGL